MAEGTTVFVGLDVHKATIAVALAEAGGGEVRSYGVIPNTPRAVARLVKKLGPAARLRVCYEAGPCGYVLLRQLTGLGVACTVVAPALIPSKPGERIKTDRKDAAQAGAAAPGGGVDGGGGADAGAGGAARSDAGAASGAAGCCTGCASGCGRCCCGWGWPNRPGPSGGVRGGGSGWRG